MNDVSINDNETQVVGQLSFSFSIHVGPYIVTFCTRRSLLKAVLTVLYSSEVLDLVLAMKALKHLESNI